MARPLKKGPPIGFRLPLDLHATLQRLAETKNQTPTQWVETKITEALQRATTKDTT